ncbi:hypothetical protein TCAL_04304 [Tigriopus californicus]|uniref:Chitin-binding type-2 domain-containing protein n=1 Tax=Tigriopus californicus TaxID=6832 RepID=A0A553NDI9_TIGCA|nr:hypothetical protein TCAL_04304 [Tigriopus californicus]|eukprot:TCALIF_04304-PA protein Name:"Protein of unknown function" AED:0.00 eAED:0.00 QI:103/1/1/1/0/0/3/109/471
MRITWLSALLTLMAKVSWAWPQIPYFYVDGDPFRDIAALDLDLRRQGLHNWVYLNSADNAVNRRSVEQAKFDPGTNEFEVHRPPFFTTLTQSQSEPSSGSLPHDFRPSDGIKSNFPQSQTRVTAAAGAVPSNGKKSVRGTRPSNSDEGLKELPIDFRPSDGIKANFSRQRSRSEPLGPTPWSGRDSSRAAISTSYIPKLNNNRERQIQDRSKGGQRRPTLPPYFRPSDGLKALWPWNTRASHDRTTLGSSTRKVLLKKIPAADFDPQSKLLNNSRNNKGRLIRVVMRKSPGKGREDIETKVVNITVIPAPLGGKILAMDSMFQIPADTDMPPLSHDFVGHDLDENPFLKSQDTPDIIPWKHLEEGPTIDSVTPIQEDAADEKEASGEVFEPQESIKTLQSRRPKAFQQSQINFSCTAKEHGYYADRTNCRQYFVCMPNKVGGGRRWRFSCGPGTKFSSKHNACIHDRGEDC